MIAGGSSSLAAAAFGGKPKSTPASIGSGSGTDVTSLDIGWHFHPGDILPPPLRTHQESYMAAKAGGARGAAALSFDDGEWRVVDLPHDWAVEAPPVASENLAQGYRKRGFGWYRRYLDLDPGLSGRYLELRFGGIATNATVWFNGSPIAHNWSGYTGFSADITALATFGDATNVIAVRVDADAAEGWWYEGAGIYRDVELITRAPISMVTDGIHADPRRDPDGGWRVPVEVIVFSIEKQSEAVSIAVDLLDADDRVVASTTGSGSTTPLGRTFIKTELADIRPGLWTLESPRMYRVRSRLIRNGRVVDERSTPCGFRTIRFDAQKGFFLNEISTKIKGVCLHPDHAGVGVAVPPALIEWRVRQLIAMGCNAIRCSHGAPDTALLEVCDRLGVLVMDENRNFNVAPDYLAQLEWLVRRDRNHPCVILWSVFNEEPVQGSATGYEMVRRAIAVVKALDDSRPVTAAMNSGMFAPSNVGMAVDVVGFNYQSGAYDGFHTKFPDVPIMSSEDTSAFMTRGEWTTDKAQRNAASDDTQRAAWGMTHRAAWKAIDTRPFLAGGFVWTGFDYHGEPAPYDWPANSSYFGIFDLCGFPKSAFYLHRAMWVKDRPLLDILPHWNWAGREGQPIKVMLATNVERVELRCNGQIVGEGKPDPYDMIAFDVPYAPGSLEARGWNGSRVVAAARVETVGDPVRLNLIPDRRGLAGDGVDAQPIRIEAVDARGRPHPLASQMVTLSIAGPGRLIGVGNGNQTSIAPSKGTGVSLFNGLAQAIVRGERRGAGRLIVTASTPGLRSAVAAIVVAPASRAEALPPAFRQAIRLWRQSPIVDQPVSVAVQADNDMNSWDPVIAGQRPASAGQAGFVTLLARVTRVEAVAGPGAMLRFARVAGSGSVLLDGVEVATKTDPAPGPLAVPLPAGRRDIAVALVLRTEAGKDVGLPGVVFIEAKPLL